MNVLHAKTILFSRLPAFARANRLPLLAASVQWLLSFVLERRVLVVSPLEELPTYLCCKLLLFPLLFLFWRFLWRALLAPDRKERPERKVLFYALPCLLALVIFLLCFHPFQLSSDELNIYNNATRLDDFAYWFVYLTGYYCILCLMVLPHFMGPTLIKILLQALLCGYCVSSLRRITGSRWSLLLYLLFLSPPMLTQGISAHRMPTYGVLFLFLVAKLVFDRLERKALPLSHAVGLCILASILTYWRSEGIYLLVFGIVWILLAYRIPRGRAMARLLVLFYGIQLLTAAPQLLAMAQSDAPSELRLEPLYAYAVTNMLRCGLDRDAAAEDLAVIDQYIPLETLDTLNETRGDENYGGANALYYTRDGATYKLRLAFCAAARHLIFQQPLVYLLSQWGAWLYLESLSPLDFSGGLSGIVQGLSMFTWRITPPLLLLVACLLISLFQRRWFLFWLSGCGVGNWLLVALLMPAAFFKYFYATWLMGWFLTLAVLILLLARQRGRRLA